MNLLTVIPARGGSKGIPRKNLADVGGLPLVGHAIRCAERCKTLGITVVSSEDKEILRTATALSAVTLTRPAHLATDECGTMPVLRHALQAVEAEDAQTFDAVVLLEPTGVMRLPWMVDEAVECFQSMDVDLVVSASESHRHPHFSMVRQHGPYARLWHNEGIVRRQDAPASYDLAPAVWVFSRRAVIEENRLPSRTVLYRVPEECALDLDTPLELELVRAAYAIRR